MYLTTKINTFVVVNFFSDAAPAACNFRSRHTWKTTSARIAARSRTYARCATRDLLDTPRCGITGGYTPERNRTNATRVAQRSARRRISRTTPKCIRARNRSNVISARPHSLTDSRWSAIARSTRSTVSARLRTAHRPAPPDAQFHTWRVWFDSQGKRHRGRTWSFISRRRRTRWTKMTWSFIRRWSYPASKAHLGSVLKTCTYSF